MALGDTSVFAPNHLSQADPLSPMFQHGVSFTILQFSSANVSEVQIRSSSLSTSSLQLFGSTNAASRLPVSCCISPDKSITTCFNHETTHLCSFCCLAACPYVSFSSEEPTSEELSCTHADVSCSTQCAGGQWSTAEQCKHAQERLSGLPPLHWSEGFEWHPPALCRCAHLLLPYMPVCFRYMLISRHMAASVGVLMAVSCSVSFCCSRLGFCQTSIEECTLHSWDI